MSRQTLSPEALEMKQAFKFRSIQPYVSSAEEFNAYNSTPKFVTPEIQKQMHYVMSHHIRGDLMVKLNLEVNEKFYSCYIQFFVSEMDQAIRVIAFYIFHKNGYDLNLANAEDVRVYNAIYEHLKINNIFIRPGYLEDVRETENDFLDENGVSTVGIR